MGVASNAPAVAGSRGVSATAGGREADGSWRRSVLRSLAGALDRAPAGALPVDYAHGARRRGRVLDLHLRGLVEAGTRLVGPACSGRLPLRGHGDRPTGEARTVSGRPV